MQHYDMLMNVETPRTRKRKEEEEKKKQQEEEGDPDAYDPLYDWSLYGREDHPAWLQWCREKKMEDEARAAGRIPSGTLDFDGVDRYGPDDPFIFDSYPGRAGIVESWPCHLGISASPPAASPRSEDRATLCPRVPAPARV